MAFRANCQYLVTFDQCPALWLVNISSSSTLIGSQPSMSSAGYIGGPSVVCIRKYKWVRHNRNYCEALDKNIQWQAFHHLYRLNEMKGIFYSVFATPFCSLSFSFRYHWKGENNINVNLSKVFKDKSLHTLSSNFNYFISLTFVHLHYISWVHLKECPCLVSQGLGILSWTVCHPLSLTPNEKKAGGL